MHRFLAGLVSTWLRRTFLTLAVAVPVFFVVRSAAAIYTVSAPRLGLILVACLIGMSATHLIKALIVRRGWLVIGIFATCGVVLALLLPEIQDGYAKVEIVATGEHDPRSDGTEVWAPDVSPGRVYFAGQGWERRDSLVVSYAGQPNKAELQGKWSAGDAIRLSMHPHSGIALVKIDGTEQRVNLYSVSESTASFELPPPAASLGGQWRRALYGAVLVFAIAGLGAMLSRWRLPGPLVLSSSAVLAAMVAVVVAPASYPGDTDLLAYGSAPIASLKAETPQGLIDLPLPATGQGLSVRVELDRHDRSVVKLESVEGNLRRMRALNGSAAEHQPGVLRAGVANNPDPAVALCASGAPVEVFAHDGIVSGEVAIRVLSENQAQRMQVPARREPGFADAYVVANCDASEISLAYSNAYVRLSPWVAPYSYANAVLAFDASGKSLPLLQVSHDGPVGFDVPGRDGTGVAMRTLERTDSSAFLVQKILAVCLAFATPFLIWIVATNASILRNNWKAGRALVASWLYFAPVAWIVVVAFIQWPGTIAWDAYSPFLQVQTGRIIMWYGIGYPMITGAITLLARPVAIGVLQCSIAALVLQSIMVRCAEAKGAVRWIAVALCAFLPLTVIPLAATTYSRDALNGILAAACFTIWAATMFRLRNGGGVEKGFACAALTLVALCLVILRIDNLVSLSVLVVATPLLLPRGQRRQAAIFGGVLLVMLVMANPAAERIIVGKQGFSKQEKSQYFEASLVSPLVGFLSTPDNGLPPALRQQLQEDLAEAVNVPAAIAEWTPFNVIWWHQQIEHRLPPSDSDIKALRKDVLRAVLADPVRYLEMRSAVLMSMLGNRWLAVRGDTSAHLPPSTQFIDRTWMTTDPDSVAANRLLGLGIERRSDPGLSRELLGFYGRTATTLPQFLICVVLVCLIRRLPVTGAIGLALLARSGVFFAMAPADVFLYLFDMYFMGYLLIPLAVMEYSGWHVRLKAGANVNEGTLPQATLETEFPQRYS